MVTPPLSTSPAGNRAILGVNPPLLNLNNATSLVRSHPTKVAKTSLWLADQFAAEEQQTFTFADAVERTGMSPSATANLLRRMAKHGLIDRVRRGHYALRQLGMLGTTAAAEELALAVGAAFSGRLHRIAYGTALYEHGLITHSPRVIQVATDRRTRMAALSGRPVQVIVESTHDLSIGRDPVGSSAISDIERALIESAARPDYVGGGSVLAEALEASGGRAKPEKLRRYARQLSLHAALRRLGSLADALDVPGLADHIHPINTPTSDIQLEPRNPDSTHWRDAGWRDAHWRVTWDQLPSELANVASS
jgi:predicted transcriptional regulator of viral defense system